MTADTTSERLLRVEVILCLALICMLFFIGAHYGVTDPDIWWHLRNADQLVHTHHIIRADTLTYTVAGRPWVNIEWLAELPYYFAYRVMGDSGLFLIMMLLSSAIMTGIYWLAYQRSRDALAALVATFVALLCAESLQPAPTAVWLAMPDHRTGYPVAAREWPRSHRVASPAVSCVDQSAWFLVSWPWGFMLLCFCMWLCRAANGACLYSTRWSAAQRRESWSW